MSSCKISEFVMDLNGQDVDTALNNNSEQSLLQMKTLVI